MATIVPFDKTILLLKLDPHTKIRNFHGNEKLEKQCGTPNKLINIHPQLNPERSTKFFKSTLLAVQDSTFSNT